MDNLMTEIGMIYILSVQFGGVLKLLGRSALKMREFWKRGSPASSL